jgi:CheY-like chemotaxis protein
MLFAEDDPDDRTLLEHALAKLGMSHYYIAEDGVVVIDYLQGKGEFADKMRFPTPACLILDVHMPRMNGIDVLEWLKQNDNQWIIPTVLLTGAASDQDLRRAYQLGVRTVFQKPAGMDCLVHGLRMLEEYWSNAEIPIPEFTHV